ncbi:hypothetical protein L8R80_20675 [Vibrio splendidus]|uniref:hypothetical protein n=1 Tax=Vibrio splendidus TaxID=29497 RepID=UPI000D3886BF|nr:hypothetical protein [Vibrio splendidus]MDH5912183.1 hypothetical protein [Vibrio splendidus]MDH5940805.1 hypothetical protein [Vibrio splendidus]MDH5985023.1 hypothetical protein [Vibrio splendidus]MDH5995644.1 hypothetical protein [Vibrio splendidus]MDH6005530.1 hypothetical protein [Vibrio splendidus]
MNETCMMSLTRDEVAERKDYDAIKASFDDLWSSIDQSEDAAVSICTSEGTCLFVDRKHQLYNIKLGVDQNEEYLSCRMNQVGLEEVERFLYAYCTYNKSQLIELIKEQNEES